ncbi:type II toxin-antitoxin system VapC family toxin [Microbacterium sp. NPDC086615]|jgi:predicted nucleic acid-binding protein|uniref:type II toxin-antitoxin system VapC family toxin n=1 Tax=Microbacterium sp. NPDC086615 TaxID=3154865 RepID=UPI00342B90F8
MRPSDRSTSPIAVDTSVAVPLLVRSHENHERVRAWARGRELRLSGHAAIETYSVLTRLPGDARVDGADAITVMDHNFGDPLTLSPGEAASAHRDLSGCGIAGGATYDGLVALAARVHTIPLATRDARARGTYEAVGVTVELVV